MKRIPRVACVLAVLLLPGCTAVSESTQQVLDMLVSDGALLPEQRDMILESLGTGWDVFLSHAFDILAGAVFAYTGVNLRRGPATRRENVLKAKERTSAGVG